MLTENPRLKRLNQWDRSAAYSVPIYTWQRTRRSSSLQEGGVNAPLALKDRLAAAMSQVKTGGQVRGSDMTQLPFIRDYMATDLITLTPDTEINRAMAVLLDAKISGAPVVDSKGGLVGVLY